MSSSTAALSPAQQQEMNELMSEIAFQKVLLSSVDENVENRAEAEDEVRAEIKLLEKKIRALKRGTTIAASQSTQLPSSLAADSPSTPLKSRKDFTMDDFAVGGSRDRANKPAHKLSTTSSTSSTSNSKTSFDSSVTPSKMDLPTRKRSHSTHMDGGLAPFEDNKSRRTTPSPYATDVATPSTSDLDDEIEMFDSTFFHKQQQGIEDRIAQEKKDAEYARSLSNDNAALLPAAPSHARKPPSAFDRLSGVRHPPASSSTPRYSFQNSPESSKDSTTAPIPKARHKPEPSTRNMPGAFGSDSSAASDSDIEIIGSDAFHDNGRYAPRSRIGSSANLYGTQQAGMQRPNLYSKAVTADEAARRRVEQGPTFTSKHTALYNPDNLLAYLTDMATHPLPNSSQTAALPGSYVPHSRGISQAPAMPGSYPLYGNTQVYGNNGALAGNNGTYLRHPDGSMHNAGPGGGYSLNALAGGGLGNTYNSQPSPLMSAGVNPFSRPPNHMTDIFNRPAHLGMADQYDYIMNDPRKTNDEIKTLLENIRPDIELPKEDREGTPDGLKYPLYEHQKLALTWMKSMEEGTNKGGILADDMGLGKTISTLALMLSRPSTDRTCKTTLIVGPVALVRQWEREIRQKIELSHRMSVHMVHGQSRKFSWDELRIHDVVLTTYGTVAAEYRRLEKWLQQQKEAGHERDFDQAPMKKLFPLLGPKSVFYRIILDEAQCIKNKATSSARAAKELQARTRFCLTGTPMMNNVGELYSLIHFLRIKPYNEWTRFNEAFGKLTKGDASQAAVQSAMRKLQAVIKAILLRRTKTSLIDGKPIITLPPKSEEIQHVVFNDEEQAYYNSLESKTRIQFNKYVRANTVGKNYSNVLVLLLRLRQACCHPHLITHFEEAAPAGVDLTEEDMVELAKTLDPDVIGRLVAVEAFECPVCYDAVDNPTILLPCGHDTCAECLTKVADQAIQQEQAAGVEANAGLKCPVCRGKIDLKKIIDYSTFQKVHMPEEASLKDVVIEDGTEMETDDDSDSESDCGSATESGDDADNNEDLRNFIVPDDVEDTQSEDDGVDGDDEAEAAPKTKTKAKKDKKDKKDKRRKSKKGKKKVEPEHVSLAMLKKEASKNAAGRRRYMRYLRKNWEPSAKVDKCVELLDHFQSDGKKTIVFSQFVSLLDLLQVPIDEKRWKVERYDGSMNAEARNDAIVRFTDDPNIKIMLVSLKAGNAGLNLVAASRVIILDPFWNPFIEMQAVDRAYRIGQQNPVEVHRILIKGTVEDRIIELQEAKRKLVNSALDEVASREVGRLDVGQLAFLFGVGAN